MNNPKFIQTLEAFAAFGVCIVSFSALSADITISTPQSTTLSVTSADNNITVTPEGSINQPRGNALSFADNSGPWVGGLEK